MDNKEDSGFDSDQKSASSPPVELQNQENDTSVLTTESHKQVHSRASDLQKKIEKQREKNRRKQIIDEQPKRSFLLPRSRLNIPSKSDVLPVSQDQQPLVAIMSDDSEEDEFAVPHLSRAAQKEITEQLIKDGYNLDLEPDDEDLDLIPPRPLNERCACCPYFMYFPKIFGLQ